MTKSVAMVRVQVEKLVCFGSTNWDVTKSGVFLWMDLLIQVTSWNGEFVWWLLVGSLRVANFRVDLQLLKVEVWGVHSISRMLISMAQDGRLDVYRSCCCWGYYKRYSWKVQQNSTKINVAKVLIKTCS